MIARIRKSMEKSEGGFTLIELLVVMIIIGILASIAIPTFLNQRKNGYRSAVQSDLRNAQSQIESWSVDNGGTYVGMTTTILTTTAGFVPSSGVTIHVATTPAVSATGYCVWAGHSGLGGDTGEKWQYSKGSDKSPTKSADVPTASQCSGG